MPQPYYRPDPKSDSPDARKRRFSGSRSLVDPRDQTTGGADSRRRRKRDRRMTGIPYQGYGKPLWARLSK
jgi:hypothetical protein